MAAGVTNDTHTHINVHQTANASTQTHRSVHKLWSFSAFACAAMAAARKVLRFMLARCAKLIGVHVDVIS